MDIVYWGKYVVMVLFGILLMLLSMREYIDTLNLSMKPSHWLLCSFRYLGLFILVYCTYCLMVDVIIFVN